MTPLAWTLVVHSVLALLLAAAGAASARWSSRPGMTYAFCALAIGVLLAPPLVELKVLPAPSSPDAPLMLEPDVHLPSNSTALATLPTPTGLTLAQWLLVLWGVGSLGISLLALWRLRRFSAALADCRPAPAEIQRAAQRIGHKIGLRRVPPILLTSTAITPLLRPRGRSLEILFPARLLERLTPVERDTLLAHELCHVRRRDHWMRLFEFAGASLFWWHPAVWWARRQLRRAEEQLCDRRVLDHMPQFRAAYARGLFKTAEYLAHSGRRLPVLACGAGEARFLKERLLMIVEQRRSRRLSNAQRILLTLLAIGLLVFLPTWADRSPDDDAGSGEMSIDARERILELEQRAHVLESQFEELRVQQLTLQGELRLQRELGDGEQAAQRELVIAERLVREVQLQREVEGEEVVVRELELDARAWQLERHAALEQLAHETQRAAADGDEERARALQRQMEDLQVAVEHEMSIRSLELDRRRLETEMRHREKSNALQVEEAARMLDLQSKEIATRRALEAEHERRQSDSEVVRLHEQIKVLKMKLEAAQSSGR